MVEEMSHAPLSGAIQNLFGTGDENVRLLEKLLHVHIALRSGEMPLTISETGEDGVCQMRALLGLKDMITNVNLPNRGQIPNLPMGAVVETNAAFRDGQLTPLLAGPVPASIYPLISRIAGLQAQVAEAAWERDLDKAFYAFINDPLMDLDVPTARKLFDEMVDNTKAYLTEYFR